MAELEESMPCSVPATRQKDDYMGGRQYGVSLVWELKRSKTAAYASREQENISDRESSGKDILVAESNIFMIDVLNYYGNIFLTLT